MTSRNWACSRVRFVAGFTPVVFRLGTLQTPTSSRMSLTIVVFNWTLTWMKIVSHYPELKYFHYHFLYDHLNDQHWKNHHTFRIF
jgi:hypothetical protein